MAAKGWKGLAAPLQGWPLFLALTWLAWFALHVYPDGGLWGPAKGALRAGELLLGLALPLWLGVNGRGLSAALLAASLAAAWGLAQSWSGPGSWLNAGREAEVMGAFQAAAAGMGHHNQYGAYFAAALPLSLAAISVPRWRRGALACTLLCALALGASASRGAWLGLALGVLAALPLLGGRARAALLGAALVGTLVLAAGPFDALRTRARRAFDDPDRGHLAGVALQVWNGAWQWGRGPGAIARELPALAKMPGRPDAEQAFSAHLHNTYLQWAVEFGLMAALLPLALLAWLALQAWKASGSAQAWGAALLAMLAAFAFQAMTDVLTLHARGAALSLCWGMAWALLRSPMRAEGRA